MEKRCAACGRVFEPHSNAQRFCSRGCRVHGAGWRPPAPQSGICAQCGRAFEPRTSAQRFCSRTCAAQARKGRRNARAAETARGPRPRCRLEQTALLAQQAGMSYGRYSVYRFLGWLPPPAEAAVPLKRRR